MSFSYIEDMRDMTKLDFQKYILSQLEEARNREGVSIDKLDDYCFGDEPLYSECLKDPSKLNKWLVSSTALCLRACLDEMVVPKIIRSPERDAKLREFLGIKQNASDLWICVGATEELGD